MAKKTNLNRFQKECLRGLYGLPNTPCSSGIRRNEEIKSGKRETPDLPGCPWSCASERFNYCFWCLANDELFDDHSVKEISSVLALSPAQIDKALSLAIKKLQVPELKEEVITLSEIVQESVGNSQNDNTLYLVYNLSEIIPKNAEDISITEVNKLLESKKK